MNFKPLIMAGSCAIVLVTGTNLAAWVLDGEGPAQEIKSPDGTIRTRGQLYRDVFGDIRDKSDPFFRIRTRGLYRDPLGDIRDTNDPLFRIRTRGLYRDPLGDIRDTNDPLFRIRTRGQLYRDVFGDIRDKSDPFFRIRTRGNALGKRLFVDEDFRKKADVDTLRNAIMSRNVEAMMNCAWDLKGLELILGKKDKMTTSAMIFAYAAKLAVEQGNAAALKQIIVLAPECKNFEEQLAFKGKTRGMNNSVCPLPQILLLSPKDYKKALESLQVWQQPVFDDYICPSFRGMSKQSAATASALVNEGRIALNPQMIAMGALELSKYSYNKELGIKFEPAQIFAEAVELAILKRDKDALTQLAALYSTASFKKAEYAKYIQSELSLLSSTRGVKRVDGLCAPGDFNPMKLLTLERETYYEGAPEALK